jgi:2-hydroxymuconate-semialdehyde hydrolase
MTFDIATSARSASGWPHRRYLAVGTYLTHLAIAGDPDGPPVLLLHGTGPGATGALNFQPLMAKLSRYHCFLPDLIGFGESSHPDTVPAGPGPWFHLRVSAVLQMLDGLELEKVHVVGHSYGARIALELLQQAPHRFGKVVLAAGGGSPVKTNLQTLTGFYSDPTEARMNSVMTSQMTRLDPTLVGQYAKERFAIAMRPDVRRSFEASMAAGDPAPVYDATVLRGIQHSVLAVHGRDDGTIPSEASVYFAEHIPDCDLYLFARCGHQLQFEMPSALGSLIDEFLGRA